MFHITLVYIMSNLLMQETPKAKRLYSGAGDVRRPAKKPRRDSSTSNSNRVGSISPTLNHSTPPRKSGSGLLNRPANIARPVSNYSDVFVIFSRADLFVRVIIIYCLLLICFNYNSTLIWMKHANLISIYQYIKYIIFMLYIKYEYTSEYLTYLCCTFDAKCNCLNLKCIRPICMEITYNITLEQKA